MRGKAAYTAVLTLTLGLFMTVAAWWLCWDLLNSLVYGPWFDWEKFCELYRFPAPFFLHWWTCRDWTGAFDLSLLLAGLGVIVSIASAYVLGFYAGRRQS